MCSTPFGIKEFCTPTQLLSYFPLHQCSTPFGIKEFCTFVSCSILDRSAMCSTPFGIKEFCTPTQLLSYFPLHQCSTPFGIKEFCTFVSCSILDRSAMCSTPFGIKEFCTLLVRDLEASLLKVLNAFRHQRILHLDDLARLVEHRRRAQRLSASKNSALERYLAAEQQLLMCSTPFGIKEFCTSQCVWRTRSSSIGAQRLSASKNSAPRQMLFVHATLGRCSTPFGIKEFCTCPSTSAPSRPAWCSTPFGIKEFCTTPMLSGPGRRTVLNAFRHQRILHHPHAIRSRTTYCAQRLSASKNSARYASAVAASWMYRVLNAFRHQRILHRIPPHVIARARGAQRLSASKNSAPGRGGPDGCGPRCAQRLSASKNSAPGRGRARPETSRAVLNAFRHQRILHCG